MDISDEVWKHLQDVYGSLSELDSRILSSSGTQRMIFSKEIFYPANLEHIRDALKLVGFGEGKHLVDLGAGDGRVVEIAYLMGGHADGPESKLEMYDVAQDAFKALAERGVKVPDTRAVEYRDAMKYPIGEADVMWVYLIKDRMMEAINKFHRESKLGSIILIYSSSPQYREVLSGLSLEEISAGNLSEYLLIVQKK